MLEVVEVSKLDDFCLDLISLILHISYVSLFRESENYSYMSSIIQQAILLAPGGAKTGGTVTQIGKGGR